MLANATVTALVGTMQKEASTAFYRDTLGLKFITDDGFAAVFEGKNARVRVSRVPAITPATYAVLAFQVGKGFFTGLKAVEEVPHVIRAHVELHLPLLQRLGEQFGTARFDPSAGHKNPPIRALELHTVLR